MSERIIIALIGIVPSALVAIVSIISNNMVMKLKIEQLEKQVSQVLSAYDKTDFYRTLSREQTTLQIQVGTLIHRIDKLEQEVRGEIPKENTDD